ncbi:immunoglobulin-like domain-containing protein, partial [Brevibacillus sp. SIMBA_040]
TVKEEAGLTDQQAVDAAKTDLDLGDTTAVTANLTLPATGANGVAISWASTDETVVGTDGTVTRPANGSGDATVTLTATLTKGSVSETKAFTVTVKEEAGLTDQQAVDAAKTDLDLGDTTAVTTNLTLPATGANGVAISWASTDETVVGTDGTVTRPANGSGDATVTLTATLTKGSVSQTKAFTVTVKEETP